MEAGAQDRYEFTTSRTVRLIVGIILWLLLGVARTAGSEDAGFAVGFLVGTLLSTLLASWIVRSLFRLVRRRPVVQPAWTPGLFFGAAVLVLLANAGNASS